VLWCAVSQLLVIQRDCSKFDWGCSVHSSGLQHAVFGDSVELRSPLTPDQCLVQLRLATDPYWRIFGSKPVIGWVRDHKFSGFKRINYRNSWQTHVAALIETGGTGSRITLRFRMHWFVLAFMVFWFSWVILIGGAIFISGTEAYMRGAASKDTWVTVVVPSGMAVFGLALSMFGRWLARNEQAFLLDFIKSNLKARELVQ
jgi:hypothetical protein